MKHLIFSVDKIDCNETINSFEIKAIGTTRTFEYSNPSLEIDTSITKKEFIVTLYLNFYADDENAIFQREGKIDAEITLSTQEYPNLKEIIIYSETNKMNHKLINIKS